MTDITASLEQLSDQQLQELYTHLVDLDTMRAANPLDFFDPYPPQIEFFRNGTEKRERLFMAGNQTGKSTSGGFETACHLTGIYPPWWQGKRFNRPTVGWACGQSGTQIRETIQLKLVGMRDASEPTGVTGGLIAKHLVVSYTLSHGTGDLFDSIRIRHVSGGISTLSFKSYEMESTKWQGQTLDFVWADEEPPIAHYNEALARLTGAGCAYITFTPLLGYSEVVSRFLRETDPEKLAYRSVTRMGLKDVGHFSEQEKQARLSAYAVHEREARENGDPVLGTGAVFTVPQADIAIDTNLHIPLHWSKLWGVDYGVTHPFAAVLMAWDRDADVIYILDTVRLSNSRPIEHASAMKRIASDVRVAWPHDGNKRESDLDTLTSNYRREGLSMLPSHAAFPDGSISTEAGVLEMQDRMATGRLRVRAHLADWFDEFRSYHRDKEGRLVKIRDDLLSATRIAVMAKRFSRPGPIGPGSAGVTRRAIPAQARNVDYDMWA